MGMSGELCPRGCAHTRGVSTRQTGAMAPRTGPEGDLRGCWRLRLEAGLQERPATWLGGGQGPAVTGGAQSASADTEGLPRLFLTPAQFREETH